MPGSREPTVRPSPTAWITACCSREVQHGDTRVSYFTPSLSTASSGYLSAPVIDLIKPYRRLYVA